MSDFTDNFVIKVDTDVDDKVWLILCKNVEHSCRLHAREKIELPLQDLIDGIKQAVIERLK